MPDWKLIKELHANSTAGAKEGLAFRYFSRPLASFLLYYLKDSRVTPNQVTIFSLLVAVSGSLVHVFWLSYWGLLLGGMLFMLAHMFDALDGQLARQRKAGSVVGMYFDFFIDEVKAYMVYGAIVIRLFRQDVAGWGWTDRGLFADPTWFLDHIFATPTGIMITGLLGMAALAIGISCTQFVKRREWLEAFPPVAGGGPRGVVALVEKAGHFVVDYPSYIFVLCLLNRVDLYVIGYTIVVAAYAIRALFSIARRLWLVDPYGGNGPGA